jgi:hypothetical protein
MPRINKSPQRRKPLRLLGLRALEHPTTPVIAGDAVSPVHARVAVVQVIDGNE